MESRLQQLTTKTERSLDKDDLYFDWDPSGSVWVMAKYWHQGQFNRIDLTIESTDQHQQLRRYFEYLTEEFNRILAFPARQHEWVLKGGDVMSDTPDRIDWLHETLKRDLQRVEDNIHSELSKIKDSIVQSIEKLEAELGKRIEKLEERPRYTWHTILLLIAAVTGIVSVILSALR